MSNSKIRKPNEEQKKAIEHFGGVLLSAGAGSGKTFVLVEHVIYLFEQFYKNNKCEVEDFERKVKNYFSQIVIMTFTTKAAGELKLRIENRFNLSLDDVKAGNDGGIPLAFWEIGKEAIAGLFVGTIHGFCYRLISQGFIPGLTGKEELINDVDFVRKISILVDQFFENKIETNKSSFFDRLVLNKKNIKKAIVEVFSDTDLRVMWSDIESDNSDIQEEYIEKILEELIGVKLVNLEISYEDFRPKLTKKGYPGWFVLIEDWHKRKEGLTRNVDLIIALSESLNQISQLRIPKNASPEVINFLNDVRNIRDKIIKPHLKNFVAYRSSPEILNKWGKDIFNIFRYVERNYLKVKGITFTDLEFFVWKKLLNVENAKRVKESYSYFIIDEFQDTSSVQFEIVKSITDSDMMKVFSVGDVKQAIYGFRGGELGVFQNASEETYHNLPLKNNYRSSPEVINFNNKLFHYLLPLGKDYEGEDRFSVKMEEQNIPKGVEKRGAINCYSVEIKYEGDEEIQLYQTDINRAESYAIAEVIQNKAEDDEYCILYRKLAPTKFLIPMLVKRNIAFSSQIKIDLKEDPVLCLFIEFARTCAFIEKSSSFKSSLLILERILRILHGKNLDKRGEKIEEYAYQEARIGLLESFKRFCWGVGLSSSNLKNSWPLIQTLGDISKDRASYVFDYTSALLQGNYSLEFQFGVDNQKVRIMTTHASKGLEFSKVILGGIHTNGSSKADNVFFGKLPGSYKWSQGIGRSKIFDSPALIYEKILKKEKEFSEFKRLFYVATTRAVHEIIWIDLSLNEKQLSFSSSSWVNGLRKFLSSEASNINKIHKTYSFEEIFDEGTSLSSEPPVYFKDNLGCEFIEEESFPFAIGAELSVTKFASLSNCPRKFFLRNVLKISEEELEIDVETKNELEQDVLNGKDDSLFEESFAEHEVFTHTSSTKTRGDLVHKEIEKILKNDFSLEISGDLDNKTQAGIVWVINELKSSISPISKIISEEPIKFSLFGQMISGTPDLVVIDENELRIWDFKTGGYSESKVTPYWIQLYCYAYAYFKRTTANETFGIKLTLAFLDEKKLVERTVNLDEITRLLFDTWMSLKDPDIINRKHCFICEYNNICSNA